MNLLGKLCEWRVAFSVWTRGALGRLERIYLRQRSSDGSVNKTILKPRLALATRRQQVYVEFSRRKILRIAQLAGSL